MCIFIRIKAVRIKRKSLQIDSLHINKGGIYKFFRMFQNKVANGNVNPKVQLGKIEVRVDTSKLF